MKESGKDAVTHEQLVARCGVGVVQGPAEITKVRKRRAEEIFLARHQSPFAKRVPLGFICLSAVLPPR
jgi:hypothetical protein